MLIRGRWLAGTLMGVAAAFFVHALIHGVPGLVEAGLACGGSFGGLLAALVPPR